MPNPLCVPGLAASSLGPILWAPGSQGGHWHCILAELHGVLLWGWGEGRGLGCADPPLSPAMS